MLHNTKISLIAATDQERGIGKNNQLLFKIVEDLKRFKGLTTGHPVIMGRKTFESIGRPLPNRTNIIVTHNASLTRPRLASVHVSHSLEKAIELAKKSEGGNEIFILGGGQIYAQSLPFADKLYLTIVEGEYDADTFFPAYEGKGFHIFREEKGESDGYRYTFIELER